MLFIENVQEGKDTPLNLYMCRPRQTERSAPASLGQAHHLPSVSQARSSGPPASFESSTDSIGIARLSENSQVATGAAQAESATEGR